MRGSAHLAQLSTTQDGAIPACAGFSWIGIATTRAAWVHPRVCGVQLAGSFVADFKTGQSPRMRGSDGVFVFDFGIFRSIPACAGFSRFDSAAIQPTRVHPRACGIQPLGRLTPPICSGPSPRKRGGSTLYLARDNKVWVHPRACGVQLSFGKMVVSSGEHPRACGVQRNN